MRPISVFLLFFLPCVVFGQVLIHPAPTIFANIGENAKLSCRFFPTIDSCYWLKDGELIEIDDRYEYTGDVNEGDCSIVINKIQADDEGEWWCSSPKTSGVKRGSKSNPTKLTVIAPPNPRLAYNGVELQTGDRIFIKKDQDTELQLVCSLLTTVKLEYMKLLMTGSSNEIITTVDRENKISDNIHLYTSIVTLSHLNTNRVTCEVQMNSEKSYKTFVRIISI